MEEFTGVQVIARVNSAGDTGLGYTRAVKDEELILERPGGDDIAIPWNWLLSVTGFRKLEQAA